MDNLDDFLKGEDEAPQAEVTTEAVEAPETAQVAEATEARADRPRDEKGRFAPKGETVESPSTEEPQFDHAATIGERRRRQEAEARAAEAEARLQQLAAQLQQQAQYQPPQGAPDRWEDPEGYDRWLVAQASTAAAETARAEAYHQFQYQRINTAAAQYRQAVPDYDEKIQVFGQMAQQNPALIAELNRAPNPAEYAYNVAKTQLEIAQYGGLDGLINARVAEALSATAPAPKAAPIPDTLADAQSARGSSAGTYAPKPLEEILGKAFRS